MQFLYPALTWGFLLALIPIAIHLINLVRQQRIEWAAMEFLLQAYQKNRRWIWLKQLFLLLMRVMTIALIVAMLAHLVTAKQWTHFLGAPTTHHLVLLDDSYSMSDRDTSSAMDRAIQAIQDLAESAAQQTNLQRMTLLRFSRAAQAIPASDAGSEQAGGQAGDTDVDPVSALQSAAEFHGRIIDARFPDYLADRTASLRATDSAVGPEAALAAAAQLVRANRDEQFVVYIVSDFRQRDWQSSKDRLAQMKELLQRQTEMRLVRCVEDVHHNLTVTELRPAEGIRAAGVPLFFDITVKNQGNQPASSAAISIFCDTYGAEDPSEAQAELDIQSLPAVTVGPLEPGELATKRFQAYFARSGTHAVRADLAPDAVAPDNQRACVVDIPEGIPTLIIDGDSDQRNARYLLTVFQPSERVQTGIRATVHDVAFLRDATADSLAPFASIFLLDVPRLDERARRNVGEYVRSGGGLAIFLGPSVSLAAYNEWQAEDPDLFPAELLRTDQLGSSPQHGSDLKVTDHPLFRALQGDSNPLLRSIRIDTYVRMRPPAETVSDNAAKVIAKVRSGHPFIMDRRVGAGRAVVVASSLAPLWNNWATQPTFVVFLLELQAYLHSQEMTIGDFTMGAVPSVTVPVEDYRAQAHIVLHPLRGDSSRQPRGAAPAPPAAGPAAGSPPGPTDAPAATRNQSPAPIRVELQMPVQTVGSGAAYTIDWNALARQRPALERAAIVSLELQRLSGAKEMQRFAWNVAPEEGAMALCSNEELYPPDLRQSDAGSHLRILRSTDLRAEVVQTAGFHWTEILLLAVTALLLLEQALAYLLSYHPAPVRRLA